MINFPLAWMLLTAFSIGLVEAYYNSDDSSDFGSSYYRNYGRMTDNQAGLNLQLYDGLSLRPNELQRISEFRLSPVSLLLCKQWARERYEAKRRGRLYQGSRTPQLGQKAAVSRINREIYEYDHTVGSYRESWIKDRSTAELLAWQVCKPLLLQDRRERTNDYERNMQDGTDMPAVKYNTLSRQDCTYDAHRLPVTRDPALMFDSWLSAAGLPSNLHHYPRTKGRYIPLQGVGMNEFDPMIATVCVAMGDQCNLFVLRAAVEQWAELEHNRGLIFQKKTERLQNQVDVEDKVINADVQAAMTDLVTSPTVNPMLIKAEGAAGIHVSESAFTYNYGDFGELKVVSGPIVRGSGTGAEADFWIKTLHRVVFGFEKPPRIEQGHIVASALGGSNTSPHNFFPQTGASNRGDYNKIEGTALALVEQQQKLEECTRIKIAFKYNGGNHWIATEGTYTLEKNNRHSCFVDGSNDGTDHWQEVSQKDWKNRPATFNVVVPTLTATNKPYQISISPQYTVPKNGLELTVTAAASGGPLTLVAPLAGNCVLKWTEGQRSTDVLTCTLTTPANAEDVTLHYLLANSADNHWFEAPEDQIFPMPHFTIEDVPKIKRGETKPFKVKLVRPKGSSIFQDLNMDGGDLTLTPTSIAGVVFNPTMITWKEATPDEQQLSVTLPMGATANPQITYTVSGTGQAHIGIPQPSKIPLPAITTNFNKQIYAPHEQVTLTLQRMAGSGPVNLQVTLQGPQNPHPSYNWDLTGNNWQNPVPFNFNAPNTAGEYSVVFALSNAGATTFAIPQSSTITVQ